MVPLSRVLVGNGGRGGVCGDRSGGQANGEVVGDGRGVGGGNRDCLVDGCCCGRDTSTAGRTVCGMGSGGGGGSGCGRRGIPSPGMGAPVPTIFDIGYVIYSMVRVWLWCCCVMSWVHVQFRI